MKSLFRYLTLPIWKPASKFKELFKDPKMLGKSSLILLLIGIIYTIPVYIASTKGFVAVVEPFLKIPAEDYYFYETFFGIPIFFLIGILFAGTTRLLSEIFNGKGSFEKNFAVLCTSMVFPMFLLMWIPESIVMFFFEKQPANGLPIPVWLDVIRQSVTMLWFLMISVIGIKYSEDFCWWKSLLITVLAFIPTGIMIIIFIR